MSRICIGILNGSFVTPKILDDELRCLLEQTNILLSYGISYDEPLLEQYACRDVIALNFSDKNGRGTCEMLFLPDNCCYNGNENTVPFYERMQNIERILTAILKYCPSFDLFIGDSGTQFHDFEEVPIPIQTFLPLSSILNTSIPPDLHLILSR